ncbi:MAG: DUF5693 family protein, partial [Negativicutes bacterium]|nr:DUF5693 family protein [Negativicutes bacterium]
MNKRFDRIMVAVVVIGFLAALPLLWHRHQLEEASRTVEIVMDYDDLQGLARKAGADPGQLLDMFRQAGVTTLAVYDTTLKKLHDNGDVTVLTGADVLRTGGYSLPQKQTADGNYDREVVRRTADITRLAGWLIPAVETGGIDLADVIVVGHDPNSFSEAVEDLRLRLGEERVTVLLGAPVSTVLVKGDLTELLKMNLGFSSREISAVNSHGFMVLPRPTNYSLVDRSKIDRTFARIDRAGQLSGIMFTGTEVLGYPDLIDYTAEQLNRRGITLGLIEHPVQYQFVRQDGLFQLVAEVGYRAARAYAIPKDEQPKMELWQAVHRWTLSDQERDIRINLLRTFEKPLPGQTLVQTNISYVSQVRQKLEDEGFAVGRAGRFSDWLPESSYGRKEANYRGFPRYMTVLCIWGTIAGGLIMIRQLVPVSRRLLYGLGAVLAVGGLLSQTSDGLWLLARQAAALTAAIVFPVLAITVAIDRWSCGENRGKSLTSTVFRAIGYLCLTVMISGVGAALLAAVLTDVRFLLEIDTYRGVKLTFI